VVNNRNKPVGSNKDFTIVLGGAKVVIEGNGGKVNIETSSDISLLSTGGAVTVKGTNVTIEGTTQLKLKSPNVSFEAANIDFGSPSSLGTTAKQVVTLGAIDSRGDTIVSKGW
jgi:uncharacterized protein (DUF2345 family)